MFSKSARCGVCWGLGLAGVVSASAAHAQESASVSSEPSGGSEASGAYGAPRQRSHEALQLTLQGSLVDYQKQTVTPDKQANSSVDPADQKTSTTSFGVLGPALGVGFGYAWDQVLFGVRANLTNVDTSLPGGADVSATQISLMPRLEYMFNRDQSRPFIAGLLGVEHTSATTGASANSNTGFSSKVEDSATAFAIGAAFGVHAFVNHSVSLDPELTVLYASGSGTVKDATDGISNPFSQDYSLSAVRVLFSLGLSGWIDTAGAPTPPPPSSEGTEAPPAPAPVAAPVAIDEPVAKPISADIHLPNHRRLYLQASQDPARDSVLVRLTEPRETFALSTCEEISIFDTDGPIKLAVRSHGEHYLTGRLSIHALEVLAKSTDANISVCADQWQLSQQSRDRVQGFLTARRNLLIQNGDSDTPTPVAPTPSAPSDAPATPPAEPGPAPATTPTPASAPSTKPTPAPATTPKPTPSTTSKPTPTGAFPASPEAAPAAPTAAPSVPPKAAKPNK